MNDRIKIKSDLSGYENKIPDTTQEGIESKINLLLGQDQKLSILSHFAKSRTDSGVQILDGQTYHMVLIMKIT